MNSNESVGKISLSMLKGRSANQSVPSISFRFSPGSDDLIDLGTCSDEKTEEHCSPIPETSPEKDNAFIDGSSSKSQSRTFGVRSSSLDGGTEGFNEPQSSKQSDASRLISRITKTFEDKINEIRSEKNKDKDTKDPSFENADELEKFVTITSKISDTPKRIVTSNENKENIESVSSTKPKTTLVQDFTEQKNKLKSDFNKNIRPKFSELRNRKSSKDNTSTHKGKSSLFQSLLGRDEGLTTEALLSECHAVDTAIEAQEDSQEMMGLKDDAKIEISADLKKSEPSSFLSTTNLKPIISIPSSDNIKTYIMDCAMEFILELLVKRRSLTTKCILFIFAICFILPLPRFIAGIIFGAVLASIAFLFLFQLIMPKPDSSSDYIFLHIGDKKEAIHLHEGLMNELEGNYFPESHHVSQTHTVLLRLQGSKLRIDTSRKKISKHAKPNEDLKYGAFVNSREYDLVGCEIILLPMNLPRKWLWSRKYPITIRLQPKIKKSRSGDSVTSIPVRSTRESPSRPLSPDKYKPIDSFTGGEDELKPDDPSLLNDGDLMSSSVDLGSYEEVTEDMCQQSMLCLFARTDREKDDWFRRFVVASEFKAEEKKVVSTTADTLAPVTPEVDVSVAFERPSSIEIAPEPIAETGVGIGATDKEKKPSKNLSYDQYMALVLKDNPEVDDGVLWFNCFVNRVLFDFLHDQYWANKIQERVQRKLSKLHIPYFVGEIVVTGVELGNCVPQLHAAGKPTMDHRGLWVDLNFAYSGSFRMTLETKLDLMKLKANSSGYGSPGVVSSPPSPGEGPHSSIPSVMKRRSYTRSPSSDCVLRNVQYDTDTDDSVESSSEEDFDEDEMERGPASKRFLRIVDTVAASRYFQQAAEWRVLQKAMKGVSRTRIELGVEVKRLNGTLALNIPPAPSDRLWYGFRGSPDFIMVAKPCLGDHQLNTLPFLAEFIQKQLKMAFEKIFVLPNMDDLVIPIMTPLLPGQKNTIKPPWEHSHARGNSSSFSANTSPSKCNVSLSTSQTFLKLSKTAEEI